MGLVVFNLSTLPGAAGGRASKIFSASQPHLPISILEATSEVDRVLVAESTVFSARSDEPNIEEKVKLVATVRGSDKEIEVLVLIAQRDKASQILSSDKEALNALAQKLAVRIAQEVQQ